MACREENKECVRKRKIQTEPKGGHPCKPIDGKMQCPAVRCGPSGMYTLCPGIFWLFCTYFP